MSLSFACSSAQPKDSLEMPNWNSAPSRNLSISKMVSGQCQNHFSPLFTYSRKVAQSFGCMESHGRTRSACKDYRKFASRYRHSWDFLSGYFCREEMVFAAVFPSEELWNTSKPLIRVWVIIQEDTGEHQRLWNVRISLTALGTNAPRLDFTFRKDKSPFIHHVRFLRCEGSP